MRLTHPRLPRRLALPLLLTAGLAAAVPTAAGRRHSRDMVAHRYIGS